MRNTTFVYQINYNQDKYQSQVFQNKCTINQLAFQEDSWNFINFDSTNNHHYSVYPSTVFRNSGKTSKRVLAKNDDFYFTQSINGLLVETEVGLEALIADSTTPTLDFSVYEQKINQVNQVLDPSIQNLTYVDHINLQDQVNKDYQNRQNFLDEKSTLDKIIMKKAKMNKFILFDNGELHRIGQNEKRMKDSGQNRVDIFSLNPNFIRLNSQSTQKYEYRADSGFYFVCKNDYLMKDISSIFNNTQAVLYNPFEIHHTPESNYENSIAVATQVLHEDTIHHLNREKIWRYPLVKKVKFEYSQDKTNGSELHQWSFVIPQNSDCYFSNYEIDDVLSENQIFENIPNLGARSLEDDLVTKYGEGNFKDTF